MAEPSRTNPTLRKLHSIGLEVEQFCHPEGGLQSRATYGLLSVYSRRRRTSVNRLTKARTFARQYPAGEALDWICGLGQDGGRPLKVTHIYALVTVKKKRVRDSLAKKAALKKWTEDKLLDEIHKRQTKRTYGGTRPSLPDDPREALLKLQQRTIKWVRVVDGIRSQRKGKNPVTGAKTKGLSSQLNSTAKAMQKLEVLLQKELS